MSQAELHQRLEGFLQKIDARAQEVMTEANQGFAGLLAEAPEDPIAFNNAMGAIRQRLDNVLRTLETAFDEQIEPKLTALDEGTDASRNLDHGLRRKEETRKAIELRVRRFGVYWEAELYRRMWPRVQAAASKPTSCAKCGAPMSRREAHRSETVVCPHCQAANQLIVEAVVQMYFGAAPHAFAEEAMLDRRLAIEAFEEQVHRDQQARGLWEAPVEAVEQLERMEREYWEQHVTARASAGPMDPEIRQRLVEDRMKQFTQFTLMQHQGWRRKHGR